MHTRFKLDSRRRGLGERTRGKREETVERHWATGSYLPQVYVVASTKEKDRKRRKKTCDTRETEKDKARDEPKEDRE